MYTYYARNIISITILEITLACVNEVSNASNDFTFNYIAASESTKQPPENLPFIIPIEIGRKLSSCDNQGTIIGAQRATRLISVTLD